MEDPTWRQEKKMVQIGFREIFFSGKLEKLRWEWVGWKKVKTFLIDEAAQASSLETSEWQSHTLPKVIDARLQMVDWKLQVGWKISSILRLTMPSHFASRFYTMVETDKSFLLARVNLRD